MKKPTDALKNLSYTDHVEIVKMLIENGADINHKDAYGRTPLMTVAGQGKQGISILFHPFEVPKKFAMRSTHFF